MPEKSNTGAQPSFLLRPFHSVQNPHHGMVPHMLGVALHRWSQNCVSQGVLIHSRWQWRLSILWLPPYTLVGDGWPSTENSEPWHWLALPLRRCSSMASSLPLPALCASPEEVVSNCSTALPVLDFSLACSVFFLLQVPTYYLIYIVCVISPIRM